MKEFKQVDSILAGNIPNEWGVLVVSEKEDVQWAVDTLKSSGVIAQSDLDAIGRGAKSVAIVGQETAPLEVHFFRSVNPDLKDRAMASFKAIDWTGRTFGPSALRPNPPVREIGRHVHDFDSAKRFLGSKEERKLANNTIIAWRTKPFQDGGGTIGVRLHGTWIVEYHEDGSVTVNSGGYQTTTTKQRINQLLPYPFGITQEKFKWWMNLPGKRRVPFHDGMRVMFGREDDGDWTRFLKPDGHVLPNPPRRHPMEAEPGSVSSGTLRAEDLLNAFTSELVRLHQSAGKDIPRHLRKLIAQAERLDTEDEDPFNAEVVNEVIDELMDELEHFAPDGYYFGAHPGDGADFGYWAIEQ